MEIYLGRRAVRQIRAAAREAIEEGSTDALADEIVESFSEEDIQVLEELLGGIDMLAFIASMLDDWGGDDLDELFELLESTFAELNIDLSTEYQGDVDDTEVLENEDEFPDTEDFEPVDDEDEDLEQPWEVRAARALRPWFE